MEGQGNHEQSTGRQPASGSAFRIVIASLGLEYNCQADQSLLAGMIATGKRTLAIGCRSGGCGVCRIQVSQGQYRTGFMNRSVITASDEASGLLLACRTFPVSDMSIEPMPREGFGAACPEGLAA